MLKTLRSWVSKGRGNNQPMVPTKTPGPGAPGPIQGQAHSWSLTRTHGRWQCWCWAPMQQAWSACTVLHSVLPHRSPFQGMAA